LCSMFIRQAVDQLKMHIKDEEILEVVLRQILGYLAEFDFSQSPPEIVKYIFNIIRDTTGVYDLYRLDRIE
jgi:uncharacterized protein with ATP-grasp and redox domains